MNFSKICIEQCEAARGIEAEFGTQKALAYLVGEKFINFLEAAEEDREFRAEIPAFVAEIKTIFEPWQLAEYLEIARMTEPFDPVVYDTPITPRWRGRPICAAPRPTCCWSSGPWSGRPVQPLGSLVGRRWFIWGPHISHEG